MAIRNTYEKKTQCKQVLKRKGQALGNFIVRFRVGLEALSAVPARARGQGMVAIEAQSGESSLRLSRGLHFQSVQGQSFWKNEPQSR